MTLPSRTSATPTLRVGSWGSKPWPFTAMARREVSRSTTKSESKTRSSATRDGGESPDLYHRPRKSRLHRRLVVHPRLHLRSSTSLAASDCRIPAGALTHKFDIQGHEGYSTSAFYPDGRPGELFITMAKEGSTIGGLMDVLGTAISIGLQYGVPLEVFVNKFAHSRFEPAGFTKNPDIPIAKSIADYIFRWLGMEFIPGYREANAPRRPVVDETEAVSSTAADAEGQRPARRDHCRSRARRSRDGSQSSASLRRLQLLLPSPSLRPPSRLSSTG